VSSSAMPAISVLLVGDSKSAEFRYALAAQGDCWQLAAAEDFQTAERLIASGKFIPDVLVVAQSFPGQFSAAAVERLRRLAPLARVVGLLGSWCEGEQRTGRPWPATIRCYWHQWPARGARQLQAIRERQLAAWSLPHTASEEERFLCEAKPDAASRAGLVVVWSCNRAVAEWLCDACAARGWATVWLRRNWHAAVSGAALGIFDDANLSGPQQDQLHRLCKLVQPAPVLALLDFPRIEDVACAMQAGAAAVLSKPVQLADLYWQLDQLAHSA